jgi:hypothetical protein
MGFFTTTPFTNIPMDPPNVGKGDDSQDDRGLPRHVGGIEFVVTTPRTPRRAS